MQRVHQAVAGGVRRRRDDHGDGAREHQRPQGRHPPDVPEPGQKLGTPVPLDRSRSGLDDSEAGDHQGGEGEGGRVDRRHGPAAEYREQAGAG